MSKKLLEKLKESISSVLPIVVIVLILHFTIAPMPAGQLSLFLVGSVLLIFGMGLFTLGADMSMMPMGEHVGGALTKKRSLPLLLGCAFVLGVIITIAEPDLTVLANQVPGIPNATLIGLVAVGVGVFLTLAVARIVFQVSLNKLLIITYIVIFVLAASPLVPNNFLSIAFDSGGVTTGPITVPFIMAFGIGIASVRSGKSSEEDSFGLIAICSAGPILAVLILGIFYGDTEAVYVAANVADTLTAQELAGHYLHGFIEYGKEVAIALAPIFVVFIIFQFAMLKLPKSQMRRMIVGIIYTYIGLVLFLTGANVGFMGAGNFLGEALASLPYRWIIIPIGMIIGFFIVMAEPAVHVLTVQVEEISGGTISRKAMLTSLCIGVAVSVGLAMLRVLYGIPILYILIPGYAIALGLSFQVPKIFTGVAFDSGGVASGPMTATFLLPFAMGACAAVGGNFMTDAFGVVAMVAMTPLITIQILGFVYSIKSKKTEAAVAAELAVEALDDTDVIDFDDDSIELD